MITIVGEALIDLVAERDGRVVAQPGGGPCNTARTIGRLGESPIFIGRLSRDTFGGLLRDRLTEDGVTLAVPQPADAPTTLAVVELDAARAPHFLFHLAGTAASALDHTLISASFPERAAALHVGSLGLVMEPIASSIERLVTSDVGADTLVLVDPNCRPEVITDERAYRWRLARILRRADVVKVSTEDLAYLAPGTPPPDAAAALLGHGPSLVLLTDGPRPARAFMRGHEVSAEVPAVPVVDTIGAGDAFGGGFLAWWSRSGLARADLHHVSAVHEALRAATEVAALTCTRPGADPPWLSDMAGRPGWAGPWAELEVPLP
jgi:fructokinase